MTSFSLKKCVSVGGVGGVKAFLSDPHEDVIFFGYIFLVISRQKEPEWFLFFFIFLKFFYLCFQ